jgi:RNA polymerase sigma factor (sigma-70 family)
VIERIRDGEEAVRQHAFGDLVAGYWKPVYTHLRLTWRLSPEDAQDLTQAFFAEAFEKSWLARYDPSKARFRTFLRVCADRVVMNWRQSAQRQKRGGDARLVSLDFETAEGELREHPLAVLPEADELFRQEFIRALFARAVDDVRREYEAAGRHLHLAIFERYDLDPDSQVSYAALARELGLSTAQVTNYLAQVRRSFREKALDALRALSATEHDFRDDARALFGLER